MSDLLAILSQSAGSLSVHRAYSATVSHNLQNANTPGYSRQRAEISASLPAERVAGFYIGRGAALQGISQARDRFLEAQMPAALGRSAASAAESEALKSIQALDPNGGLTNAVAGFYSSLRALAQNPSDPGLRQGAVSSSRGMALAFNRTAQALDAARDGVDSRIEAQLPEINALAEQMASYNREIRSARGAGGEPNDLLDARQKAQDRLAELTGATPVMTGDGDVNLVLSQGTALVTGDRAAKLSVSPDINNGAHLAVQISGNGAPANIQALGGELGGLLSARDGALKTAETQLDALAFDLAGVVNTAHQNGYALDGSTGRDLFAVPTTATGAAMALEVNPDVAADPLLFGASSSALSLPGDASNLQQIIATETRSLSSGLNAASSLSSAISQFGAASQRISSVSQQDTAILGQLSGMRESVSGVSIDEELVNLTRAQRAFEAVSKVIQTTDQMLETLMQLK